MRIISQNGRRDLPYEGSKIIVERREEDAYGDEWAGEKEWRVIADYPTDQFLLASFDTEEEAKDLLLAIAKGFKHNYQIFYCGEKE